MTKISSFYIVIMALILGLVSCDKKLDVTSPQNIAAGDVPTSDENVKKALNGAYDAASNSALLGGDFLLYSELLAADDEIRWSGTFNQPREIYTKSILTNNSYITSTWDNAYNCINICNNVLNAINIVNEADQDRVKGEALFLKAFMYFELASFFSKPYNEATAATDLGVQLINKPTIGNVSEANYVPRSTLKATYDTIINELLEAKELLLPIGKNDIYANTYAASAILSRAYLQMGKYEEALNEANSVIESDAFRLTDDYADAFNNEGNSTEDIFAIQVSALDGANDMQLFWSITDYGARDGDVDVLQKHINLYTDGDARKELFYIDETDTYRSGKWKLQYRNLPIIRLAEMYLTRAECNFRLSSAVGETPFTDIETIRKRVGLTTTQSYITLDNILLERKLELAHEGQAIQDVKRLHKSVDGYAYDANELVLPIPIREINAVGKDILIQNPGYE